jgi:hypothetical protein
MNSCPDARKNLLCVRTACPKLSTSLEQAVKTCQDLLQGCSNKSDTVMIDITILLQSCVANLVTFLLYHDCIKFVRTTLEQV